MAAEKLVESADAPKDLYAADTNSIKITDWIDNLAPKLDGKPIVLDIYEQAHSVAISPDKNWFVLGTSYKLRAYNRVGEPIWKEAKQAPGIAYGLNIPREGNLVIAAYGDGTIRWHRLNDGQELLALFVHAKDMRWVAWTPKGYYAASPGGESLIGWHVNRGWDETADFFPAHRFRNRFYRPDVVQQVLVSLDEDIAVAEADRNSNAIRQEPDLRKLLPPVLEIVSPNDGYRFRDANVTLEYAARSPTGDKISNVDVYIDDQKLNARGFVPISGAANDVAKLDLVLPQRDVKVTLVARSGEKASEPRSVKLTWAGTTTYTKPQPRLLALLIGVSAYNQQALNLNFAHQDALNLDTALKAQEGKAFLKVETRVLINTDSAGIRKGFDWLNETASEGDLTLILLSGHGTTRNNTFFFLPAEADPTNLSATAISGHEIVGTVQGLPGGKLLLIDACRAGGGLVPIGMSQVPVDMNKLANDMGQPVGAIFFGSSSVGEYSYEDSTLKAGVFTAALIEGLSGKADFNGDGKVETDEMGVWLRKRVPELTEQKQHPLRHQSAPVDYTMANQ